MLENIEKVKKILKVRKKFKGDVMFRVCFKNSNIGKTFENDMENDHQRMVNSIFTLLSSESNCSVLFLKGSYFAAQFFFV